MTLLLLWVGGALAISFLCSLLEATLLSVRPSQLAARAAAGQTSAARLAVIKRERLEDAISAILTLNTIAHTVGATLAGAQAAFVFGDAWVGVFSGVLTLLVLVVTEIIPKTVGARNAPALAGFVGRSLGILMTGMRPILAVTGLLTRIFGSTEPAAMTRAELVALLGMARAQGALEGHESQVLENVLRLEEVRIEDVMTPRTVAVMLPADASAGELLASDDACAFSRIPLFEGSPDHVVGYVMGREVTRAVAAGGDRATPLASHRHDITFLADDATVLEGIRHFLENRGHIAAVVDEFGTLRGLVTFEDLIETILGAEIVDESDRVADMRRLASELREGRTRRMQARLRGHGPSDASA